MDSGILSVAKGVQMTTTGMLGAIPKPATLNENWNFAMTEFNRGLATLASSTCLSVSEAFAVQQQISDLLKPAFDSFANTLSEAQTSLRRGGQTELVVKIMKRINDFTEDAMRIIGGKLPKELVTQVQTAFQPVFDNLQATIAVWEGYTKPQDGISNVLSSIREIVQEIEKLASAIQSFTPASGAQLLADRELAMRRNFGYLVQQIKNADPIASSSAGRLQPESANTQQATERVISAINNKRYNLLQANQARPVETIVKLLQESLRNTVNAVTAKLPSDFQRLYQTSHDSTFRQIDEFLYTWSGSVYNLATATTGTAPACTGWSPWGCRSGRPPKKE